MLYTHERNYGCRINDELTYRGLRMMTVENELLRISILLDQGTDIFEFVYKPLDIDFMWRTPRGVRPQAPNLDSRPAPHGPFPDYYEGGWQEVMPNGGRTCTYKGCEMGMHGEVWGIPWRHRVLEDTPECVSVRLSCRTPRSPFLLSKTLTMRSEQPVLEIEEELTNESGERMDLMWGHHPAFGPPFLDESCIVQCGANRVLVDPNVGEESHFQPNQQFDWPIGEAKAGGTWDISEMRPFDDRVTEMTYLTDLSDGWYAITNRDKQVGFGMAFDTAVFRCLWCWQNFGGESGWPFWSRCYAMAVEPFSSYPAILTEAIDAGTQLVMEPGETITSWLRAVGYEGRSSVTEITEDGDVL